MKRCQSCGHYPFCPKINKNGCDEWIKQKYEEIERKDKQ